MAEARTSRPALRLLQHRTLAQTTASGSLAPSSLVMMAEAKSQELDMRSPVIGNVFSGSEHLPALPVPNLSTTLELLKETIWPIAMNSEEFAKALHLIEAFAGPAGQKLDLLLRTKASQTKNWLVHDWWTEEAYLKSRSPLVINSNPAMVYPQPVPGSESGRDALVAQAANLISGIIDFKLALLRGYNPEAGSPRQQGHLDPHLCYNQYRNIFGSTRMPGEQIDTARLPAESTLDNEREFNLICAHKGEFFEIRLCDIGDERARFEALSDSLGRIISGCNSSQDDEGISSAQGLGGPGVLTAARRDLWADRIKLIEPSALESIQGAQLVVSLDTIAKPARSADDRDRFLEALLDERPGSRAHMEALSRQVLHGDRRNVGNRWFDKSLQLILVADEACERLLGAGINYEHSVAEAVVVTKLIEYSHERALENATRRGGSSGDGGRSNGSPKRLRMFAAGEGQGNDGSRAELQGLLESARQDFGSQVDQFELVYFDYAHYGRDAIKRWRLSPDSWFQVGLQLAHYKLHGRLGPCYESASTRRFAYGRTETIRSLTKDVAQFCLEPSSEMMVAAIRSHKRYALAANNALAIDRALLGYRLIFNELKSNQWSWGVPTFDSVARGPGRPTDAPSDQDHLIRFNSLADTQPRQQVDINDLFTERELGLIAAFFNNELFERSKRFALSTSQVSSANYPDICMSYGPLLANGYGCCYNLSGPKIVAAITANSANQSFSCEARLLGERLHESLDRMRELVEEQGQERDCGRESQSQLRRS